MHPVQRPDATLRSARGPPASFSAAPCTSFDACETRTRLLPLGKALVPRNGSSALFRTLVTFIRPRGPCRSVSRRDNWSIRKRRTRAGIAAGSAACPRRTGASLACPWSGSSLQAILAATAGRSARQQKLPFCVQYDLGSNAGHVRSDSQPKTGSYGVRLDFRGTRE
jgi:hypothetical protein